MEIANGLLVEQAVGPAAEANIQPGDILLALNGHPLSEPGQLRTLMNDARQHVALLVLRGGTRLFVALYLG